jgi:adenine phosphoribosyltransferase
MRVIKTTVSRVCAICERTLLQGEHALRYLRAHLRSVPDFPKPGILFKDITPLLAEPKAFQASIDALYFFLVGISVFFSLLIAGLVIVFAIKYRRKSESEPVPHPHTGGATLEIVWSVIPFLISMAVLM